MADIAGDDIAAYGPATARILAAALPSRAAWERVAEWTDTFGPRLSGSDALERAIDWALAALEREGFANVRGETVMVPRWVRGRESAVMLTPRPMPLAMLGLGGSVGTPPDGVTGEVLVVSSFEELEQRAAEAAGRIVLFDVPYEGYGKTVRYRVGAASAAARVGARAALIRSVASGSMQNPHTGGMHYADDAPRIPTAALSVEHAGLLHRLTDRGATVTVRLTMEAATHPDVPSRNIVAEWPGRERPGEVVVLGGHIDSWDVGQGAMDDAGGFMAAWEALAVLRALGLQPRRTLRLVGWTNEENGLRGGQGYRDQHAGELAHHVAAIESDSGFFRPTQMTFAGAPESLAAVEAIAALLRDGGPFAARAGGPAADVGPLYRAGVPTLSLSAEPTRYFYYHHSAADAPEVLDPAELAHGVAVLATYAYVLGDMPGRLEGAPPAAD
jgi:carboxypeptidase Q